MIRVLQVLPRLRRGGSQAMVMNLYRTIDRSKIQFDFIIFTPDHDDYYDEIISLGGKIYHFEKFNGKNIFRIRRDWKHFLDAHPEYKVLHIHVYSTAIIYISIAKKRGITTIVHSHSTSNGKGIMAIVKNTMQLPIRSKADYLFACSSEAGRWLFGKKVESMDNYMFVPNGIPIEKFLFSSNWRNEIRARYGLNDDDYVIGHVGGFETPKNHSFILKVFSELLKRKDAYLMLVGDGTFENRIKKQCETLGLSNRVLFVGLQKDVGPYLSAMDSFFFPSLWEGLPVSVVEAQTSGLKCLLSDRITKDVCLTKDVVYLKLEDPIEKWVDALIDCSKESRKPLDIKNNPQINTFNIKNVAETIESFYLGCLN